MKLKQLSMLLIAAIVVIFTGCTKTDDEKLLDPTIEFSGAAGYISKDDSVNVGATAMIKMIAQKGKDGAKLKTFKLTRNNAGGAATVVDSTITSAGEETFNYTWTGTVNLETTYTFTITDKDGKTVSKAIRIKIKNGTSITTPKSEVSRSFNHMGAYDLEGLSSQGGSTAPSNPSDYDLYYFNSGTTGGNFVAGGTQNNSLLSTFAATWAGSSNVIMKTTTYDYATAATEDESKLQTIFDGGTLVTNASFTDGTRVSGLAAGQVYSVRTSSGKYALVKVNSVSGTAVVVDFLIQH